MAERPIIIALIPCGITSWREQGRWHGSTDLPLSDGGREAVATLTEQFTAKQFSSIVHPPDEAATETASIVAAKIGVKARSAAALADPDLGLLEGLTLEQFAERQAKRFRQWQDDPLNLTPPEGESFDHARTRILGALEKLAAKSAGGAAKTARRVAIILHPLGLAWARMRLCDRAAKELARFIKESPATPERYLLATPSLIAPEAALAEAGA